MGADDVEVLGVGLGESEVVGSGLSAELPGSVEDAVSVVLDDVEVSGDVAVVESDAAGVSVAVSVSVGVGLGESSSDDKESPGAMAAPMLKVVELAPAVVAAVFEEVRTVDVVGTELQAELASAIDACAAMAVTNSIATPKSASPIAAPSAAGLRSSALTVHPRFNEPVVIRPSASFLFATLPVDCPAS